MWALLNPDNNVRECIDGAKSVTVAGVQHPQDIFTKWTPEELAAIGIVQVERVGLSKEQQLSMDHEYIYHLDGMRQVVVESVQSTPKSNAAQIMADLIERNRRNWSAAIDAAAGAVHSAVFSFPGASVEFLQTEAAAQAFAAGGHRDEPPIEVQAVMDAERVDAVSATTNILATAAQYRSLLAQVRYLRLTGQAAVADAVDIAATDATGSMYVDDIRALIP
jgi:hypothetical protein